MKKLLTLSCVLLGVGLGCVSGRPVRGWMQQSESGKSFSDFRFVDDRGMARSLDNQLGDYTVLALTRCDRDTHGPAASLVESMVAENRRASLVKVVGIDVHWSADGCSHEGGCHVIGEQGDLVSICDATGDIRRLYDADDADKLYLIGPAKKIILTSAAHDVEAFRQTLKAKVESLSSARREQLDEEYRTAAGD